MAVVGTTRYIPWRIVDINSNPVANRQLSALTVTFLRNAVACSDVLTLTYINNGLYFVKYTPSASGDDYLDIYDPVNGLRLTDEEVITSNSTTVSLTQNTGGTNALQVKLSNPQDYVLYVFPTAVWQSGQAQTSNAVSFTGLDPQGNWTVPVLSVAPGSYALVAMTSSGALATVQTYLSV